jgi:hypothetical protein
MGDSINCLMQGYSDRTTFYSTEMSLRPPKKMCVIVQHWLPGLQQSTDEHPFNIQRRERLNTLNFKLRQDGQEMALSTQQGVRDQELLGNNVGG